MSKKSIFKITEADAPLIAQLPEAWQNILRQTGRMEDTATYLQLPIGTVKSRTHRARAALQKLRDKQQVLETFI